MMMVGLVVVRLLNRKDCILHVKEYFEANIPSYMLLYLSMLTKRSQKYGGTKNTILKKISNNELFIMVALTFYLPVIGRPTLTGQEQHKHHINACFKTGDKLVK